MKNIILPGTLIIVESIFYLGLCNLMNIPVHQNVKTLFIYLVFSFTYGHYAIHSTLLWEEMRNMCKALSLYVFTTVVFVHTEQLWETIIIYTVIAITMLFIAIAINRFIRIKYREILARRTLVIGMGNDAMRYIDITINNRFALTNVVAMVSVERTRKFDAQKFETKEIKKSKHGNLEKFYYDDLEEAIHKKRIHQIVIILPEASRQDIDQIMKDVYGKVKHVKYLVDGNGLITFSSKVHDFDGLLLVSTSRDVMGLMDRALKRMFDVLAGIIGCLLILPIAVFVKYKYLKSGDKESIFFTQERIGKNGKPIKIYKFRTMVPNAELILEELMDTNPKIKEEYLTNKKLRNDPRITSVGNKLRSTSLDEFPQFLNVLKGEMSLVGPRPYLFREKEDMDIYYDSIICCKPGITGMWQANGRSDVMFKDRCKLDDYYYKNWSILLDVIIIYKTIKSVLYGKGAL